MGNTSWALNGIANKSAFIVLTGIVTLSSGAIGLAWLFYKRVNRATHFDASTAQFYNIEELHSAIDDLRKEIEELKANKVLLQKSCGSSVTDLSSKPPKSVRFKRTLSVLSSSDTEVTEFQSAWSGDDSGDEFFDFFENNENTEESTGFVNPCSLFFLKNFNNFFFLEKRNLVRPRKRHCKFSKRLMLFLKEVPKSRNLLFNCFLITKMR